MLANSNVKELATNINPIPITENFLILLTLLLSQNIPFQTL